MSDKPILFSAPMVRALLAGTKTQTRRALTDDIHYMEWLASETIEDLELRGYSNFDDSAGNGFMAKPRIGWGDRLYVREAWRTWVGYDGVAPRDLETRSVQYEATDVPSLGEQAGRFRQGMHMPRWASRITLTVTDVRVQRLQDISEEDAIAEGIEREEFPPTWPTMYQRVYWRGYENGGRAHRDTPVESYQSLWNSINGPGSWDANPWVAAYTFTVALGNIDQIARAA